MNLIELGREKYHDVGFIFFKDSVAVWLQCAFYGGRKSKVVFSIYDNNNDRLSLMRWDTLEY